MNVLIKNAQIIDSKSPYNNQQTDILITNGIITEIASGINTTADLIIEKENLHLSPGFLDLNAQACDPGYEYKEDFESFTKACIYGGYTEVAVSPKTLPITQTKTQIEYVLSKTKHLPVNIIPLGAATQNLEGKELSELYDMYLAGAKGFSNAKNALTNSGLLTRLLLYLKQFNGKLLVYADDVTLSSGGQMHEGIISTQLGLKARPALAEALAIHSLLQIADYCQSPLHFNTISTQESLHYIVEAKKQHKPITCDVAAHHLFFTDNYLVDFNSNFKVLPPLRSIEHKQALINGIKEGVIDAIISDHVPQNIEEKQKEFDLASFGSIGLQTAFRAALTVLEKECSLQQIVNLFTHGPRNVLNLPLTTIQIGSEANITLFNPQVISEFKEEEIVSKSKNSMFIGQQLKGKIYGTLLNQHVNIIN
jgi:dihydroorotase